MSSEMPPEGADQSAVSLRFGGIDRHARPQQCSMRCGEHGVVGAIACAIHVVIGK
jgi:hypothetical protein